MNLGNFWLKMPACICLVFEDNATFDRMRNAYAMRSFELKHQGTMDEMKLSGEDREYYLASFIEEYAPFETEFRASRKVADDLGSRRLQEDVPEQRAAMDSDPSYGGKNASLVVSNASNMSIVVRGSILETQSLEGDKIAKKRAGFSIADPKRPG